MKKKRPKARRPSDEELLPCMDYLHGDVVGDQFKAACQYEYALESNILRYAAKLFRRDLSVHVGEIFFHTERKFPAVGNWLISNEWSFIWQCSSFPEKSWNQLSEAERIELLYGLPLSTNQPRPLRLGEVMRLTHYLDQLKEIAEKARIELKGAVAGRPPQKVYPILELKNTPFVQVLLPLDFRKRKKRLLKEIDLWLQLPENKARFDKHELKTEAGTEKEAKDRLKDLAAWRLLRGFEGDSEKPNSFANEHRKKFNARTTIRLQLQKGPDEKKGRFEKITYQQGEARPFHDARRGQSNEPLNEADLYSEATGWLQAKARTQAYLGELMPWEFGKFAQEQRSAEQQFKKRFWDAQKGAKKDTSKISKSSS